MNNYSKNGFDFDNESVLKSSFITSSTQPIELVEVYKGNTENLYMTQPFLNIQIVAQFGATYKYSINCQIIQGRNFRFTEKRKFRPTL